MPPRIHIPGNGLELEAILEESSFTCAGVVTHPHPMYGGSMDNNVVLAAAEALKQLGWTSLCFNFRGVGQSSGKFDHGQGEQADLAVAVQFLKERGMDRIAVIGYSFGAWVAAFAWPVLKHLGVMPPVLIAPPAAFMSFDSLPDETEIGLMICGTLDEIGPPQLVDRLGRRLSPPCHPEVISGADHFFGGYEQGLIRLLSDHLTRQAP